MTHAQPLRRHTLPRRASGVGLAAVLLAATACDVPAPDPDEAGIGGDASGPCARGVAVVSSDYQSSDVSLLALDGTLLTASLISSASRPAGLSAALTGDVVLPTPASGGDELVLIDRAPAGVLTWVNVTTATVSRQLVANTGFVANPHDYVLLPDGRAYVTRFEPNHHPSRDPLTVGNDVVIVEPRLPAITGRIDMTPALDGDPRYFPRADRMVRVGESVYVLLGVYTADFVSSRASRLVVLDTATDTIARVVVLEGYHACSALALAPSGRELALACSGEWGGDNVSDLETSGVVRLALDDELRELARYSAPSLGSGPVAFGVSYAADNRLLLTTFGRFPNADTPAADDTVLELDLDTGSARVVLRSAGEPFTLGDVRCEPACAVCFATDAHRDGGVVHRFPITSTGLGPSTSTRVDPEFGLPPRWLGLFGR